MVWCMTDIFLGFSLSTTLSDVPSHVSCTHLSHCISMCRVVDYGSIYVFKRQEDIVF